MPDTAYQPISWIFTSKGVIARWATDRAPDGTYLTLNNAEERQEVAMSSRYGSIIVNRDPDGTPSGTNYFLPHEIVTISRLAANGSAWRYAFDVNGTIWRRAGDTQGPYVSIGGGTGGGQVSTCVNTTFGSSTPYIFIATANGMFKDDGVFGTVQGWGIAPPTQTANAIPYAPQVFLIDGFSDSSGSYSTTNVSSWANGTVGTVVVPFGSQTAVSNFVEYLTITSGLANAFDGCLATFSTSTPPTQVGISSIVTQVPIGGFYTKLRVTCTSPHGLSAGQYVTISGTSNWIFNNSYDVDSIISATQFYVDFTSTTYQSSHGGYINAGGGGGSPGPQAVMFNIYDNPNPAQFSAIGIGGAIDPSTVNFVVNYIGGTVASSTTGTVERAFAFDLSQQNQATGDDLIVLTLQLSAPANIESVTLVFDINSSNETDSYYSTTVPIPSNPGQNAWLTYYLPMGNFAANGRAGQEGFTWANVTSWRLHIKTNSTGGITFAVNGLYQQWGAGPSSFSGVGYDYRYRFININTQTPSNPSPIQYTDEQYGYVASLAPMIVMRQAVNVSGQYSLDPQVTHVEIYRRGGTLSSNWLYIDRIPNVFGFGTTWQYKDVIPDSELGQSDTLPLDNDAPVTSSLPNPLSTLLALPTSGPSDNTPYATFSPQTITVVDNTFFFNRASQIVVIGTPLNLEQVPVVASIAGGSFLGVTRLRHDAGEPVYVFSIPQQACDLCAVAYGQIWLAGDTNNPHFLYYSKPGYPENFGPQNYIPVSDPSDPIMAVINFRGTLFVATLKTWYQIIGGATPYAQPTGSKHGLVAKHGWTQTESAIIYQAVDGIREFRGADGEYMTLIIEWLYRQVPQSYTPIPLVDRDELSSVQMAFQDNYAYVMYPGYDSRNYRLAFSTVYSRWRNDSVNSTSMYFEEDTNNLMYAKYMTAGNQSGYAVCIDRVNDYDDGGWASGVLVKTPIAMDVQTPYQDLEKPHFPKQWNTVEVDADTQGQDVTVILHFDDDNISPITLGVVNTATRQKVELKVNNGDGQEAYKVSAELQTSVTKAPNIYQLNIYYALLAANRNSFDTYWFKFGTDESKLVKEGYFDYTSTTDIAVSLYADGGTTPYYTFTLPANPLRQREPMRVRFPAIKLRMFRCIALASAEFQFWSDPTVRWKDCLVGPGYSISPLVT